MLHQGCGHSGLACGADPQQEVDDVAEGRLGLPACALADRRAGMCFKGVHVEEEEEEEQIRELCQVRVQSAGGNASGKPPYPCSDLEDAPATACSRHNRVSVLSCTMTQPPYSPTFTPLPQEPGEQPGDP
ncbi:unnamed protein product [Pleuronectes platessa]|uniref:Uncharacterized protein n=1 Tax=Pleuronectes platessa TaxID=8262 RepID=A0A9N7U7L7_PLEPL|nr:unnamed protein product [Pleuronectes platessa]